MKGVLANKIIYWDEVEGGGGDTLGEGGGDGGRRRCLCLEICSSNRGSKLLVDRFFIVKKILLEETLDI